MRLDWIVQAANSQMCHRYHVNIRPNMAHHQMSREVQAAAVVI